MSSLLYKYSAKLQYVKSYLHFFNFKNNLEALSDSNLLSDLRDFS